MQALRARSVVLRTVPRQVVRQPARWVPSWAVPWERLQARWEGFLEFHRVLSSKCEHVHRTWTRSYETSKSHGKKVGDEQAHLLH